MRRLLLGVLVLVLLLGGAVSCSTPTEEIPEKAKTRPRLVKPGQGKPAGVPNPKP